METNSKEFRNEYNRYVLRLLIKEYCISRPDLSKAIGLSLGFVREFDNGTRHFGSSALDQFEEFINTKYEPLLKQHDFELNKIKDELLASKTPEDLEELRGAYSDLFSS